MAERITARLREWADESRCTHDGGGATNVFGDVRELLSIADEVDEEHDRELVAQSFHPSPAAGFVRLPRDAHGLPIEVGDVVRQVGGGRPFEVTGMRLVRGAWKVHGFQGQQLEHMTPAERIRAWVEQARYDRADFSDLLAVADELERDCDFEVVEDD